MFIVKFKYLCPESAMISELQNQLSYFKKFLDQDKIMLIGKDYTSKEMVLISPLYHRGEFEQIIKQSPLFKKAFCTYEITSFKPNFFKTELRTIIEKYQSFRKVEIVPYSQEWAKEFEQERILLDAIYKPIIKAIHHIGSTSIPNMASKPIIDILIEVSDLEKVDPYDPLMIKHGYTAKGEYGMPGRRYFYKGSIDSHTHHVHLFESGHPDLERHLKFRDYLIAHPDEAEAYANLKKNLASQYPNDIEQYCWGKNHFISKIDEKLKTEF